MNESPCPLAIRGRVFICLSLENEVMEGRLKGLCVVYVVSVQNISVYLAVFKFYCAWGDEERDFECVCVCLSDAKTLIYRYCPSAFISQLSILI